MNFRLKIFLLFCGILLAQSGWGQDSTRVYYKSKSKKVLDKNQKLERTLTKKDSKASADAYYNLGLAYMNAENYSKAETNFLKAKSLYLRTKNKKGLLDATRKLAQVQEKLNKKEEALQNYISASDADVFMDADGSFDINLNDVKRIQTENKDTQQFLLKQNIYKNKKVGRNIDAAENFSQLAEVQLEDKKLDEAIISYKNAYDLTIEENPEIASAFNQNITEVYRKNKQIDKAIETKKELLKEPFIKNNPQLKIGETQILADLYKQNNDTKTAEKLLKETYKSAIQNGHTFEAKSSLEKLDSLWNGKNKKDSTLVFYRDFITNLPQTLAKDSSLFDSQILRQIESRIESLEKEKELQEQLIKRKNLFNYILLASVLGLLILIGIIWFTLKKLEKTNKKIALQSLRREMNPHFIFNSLNSVNNFIAQSNELEANKFLTKFSMLMRKVMENSADDFILLNEEIELLENYLSLEKTRFPDTFDYQIQVDDSVNIGTRFPVMILQPFLENSIWHGLRYLEEKGKLELQISQKEKALYVLIADNGIGIEKSIAQKTKHQKERKGRGMQNVKERIKLLNDLYGLKISFQIVDRKEPETGVLVEIKILNL